MSAATVDSASGAAVVDPAPVSISFSAWCAPVEVVVVGMESLAGIRPLVERLEGLWDADSRHSDVSRLRSMAGTVVDVEPETVALVELATRAAWRQPEPRMALHDVVIDFRHSRVGLPGDEALNLEAMIPALIAALLIRFLTENGAIRARVQVGEEIRSTGR